MAKKPSLKTKTPIGDLNWVFINGNVKQDLNGNDRYSASVYLDEADEKVKSFIKEIEDFWKEHKPKTARKAKSIGVYYQVKDLVKSEEEGADKFTQVSITQPFDESEFEKTGTLIINAWTGITWPDGKEKVIKIYNAKGAEVSLGDRKIGPGSRGRLGVTASIYENGANVGVSLYLNSIQLTKFVEFTGGDDDFEAIEDEDAWTGEDLNDDGMSAISEEADTSVTPKAKVRL